MKEFGIFIKSIAAASIMMAAAISAQAQFMNGYQELEESETVGALREHISTISAASMEGRLAGSEGERATAEYVSEVLEEYGIDVLSGKDGETFGIRQDSGDTLTSRNVIAFLQGSDPDLYKNYIVIGARMDNLGMGSMTVNGRKVEKNYYGANGNASGLAMMLELAKMLQTNKLLLRRSILFMGFGASRQTFAGSWYFLNRSFSDVANIDAMINLDMVGTGNLGFYAYTASNADLNQQLNAQASQLQPITPQILGQEPYPSDHRSFYGKEIPSVFFTTGIYPEHDTERDTQSIIDYDTMERELEYVYNFTVALANGPKPAFRPSESKGSGRAIPYYDCDVKPTFFGHSDPRYFLTKWVYSYLKYPKEAVEQGIQGNVQVSFIIDESGKVKDAKVVKSVDPLLDAEAVKVISASPDWKPGQIGGKKVKSEMTLYVEFRLEKKGSFGLKKHEN
jgi:TonB family protein